MNKNTWITLVSIGAVVGISLILMKSLALSLTILIAGTIFLYISQRNNSNRKENLNIIRDESKLYFYLSDDLLFSKNITNNSTLNSLIKQSIQNEMPTLREMTRKICFINFSDDTLLTELNQSLQLKQKIVAKS